MLYDPPVITPERFAQGMTFEEYVAYTGSPENLARESGWAQGRERADLSGRLRDLYTRFQLTEKMTPFFAVWASAAIDEILSALHERLVAGSLA